MIKDIIKVQKELEDKFISFVPIIDKAAKELYNSSKKEKARKFITQYSVNEANNMTHKWKQLGEYLLVKYIDGNIKRGKNGEFERTEYGLPASPLQPGYPDWWYEIIVDKTGEHFKVLN